MKAFIFAFLLAAAPAFGQTKMPEMPMLGPRLPKQNYSLVNQIPASRAASLPKALPIFRYSARPRDFSTNGLQILLNLSVFSGTNISDLMRGATNTTLLKNSIRLATANNQDYFFVDSIKGAISVRRHGTGVDLRTEKPPFDAIPNFDSLRDCVLRYAEIFGITTNELEHNEDGSIFLRKTDNKTVARGGAIKFMSRRSVRVARSIAGYPFFANDDRVELALGVNGRLLQFELKWRSLDAVRTNRLFSIEQMMVNIKKGDAFADEMNQYPIDGVSQIEIKDFRVFYYIPTPANFAPVSTNTDIFPIASFHAVFKSKSGKTEDGGVYTSLIQP